MASKKVRAFLVALIVSLFLFGAVAIWLIPSAPVPEAGQPVTRLWQAEDVVRLTLVLADGEQSTAAVLTFDPARSVMTVAPADNADTTRAVTLSVEGAAAILDRLGNDLPLTLAAPVSIADETGYLQLTADTHILTAGQVGLLLRHDPTLWATVIVTAVNTYHTADPQALFQRLVNTAVSTDLTMQDYIAAHDAVTCLWEQNTGHLCRLADLGEN